MSRWTGIFSITHSRTAYCADFVIYGAAVSALAVFVALQALHALPVDRAVLTALACGGFAAWSLLEYGLHRFVLHGLQPFKPRNGS